MPMLEELDLCFNPAIGGGGAVSLIRALYTSRVKTLSLGNTGIGEEDCVCLSELSKFNHHLEYIEVGYNLSSESVEMITSGVSHSSSLITLDMSHSQFSVAAVVSLASLLSDQSNCKLEELHLLDCHISSGGAVELAAALCKNTTLRTLILSGNPIGDHVEGVAAIATSLVENKSLIRLKLQDCNISGQGADELAVALYKNSTLEILDLDCNPISVEGASAMSDMLQHNTSLTMLYMGDDSVGEAGVRQLMNSLKYNQTLEYLWLLEKYKSETSDRRILWL